VRAPSTIGQRRRQDARLQAKLIHDAGDVRSTFADALPVGANTGTAHIVDEPIKELLAVLIDRGKKIAQVQVFP
jgi:hypothetical protein